MKQYIIDIDGTVLSGNEEINDSSQFIHNLQKKGINFLLATNSIKSHQLQVSRLSKVGINVMDEQIYSPIDSINVFLKEK